MSSREEMAAELRQRDEENDRLRKALEDIRVRTYYKNVLPSIPVERLAHDVHERVCAALAEGGNDDAG